MSEKKETIGEFELVDFGIGHFRGFYEFAVAIPECRFSNSVIGVGDDLAEAVRDCLGQIARGGTWDIEGMEARIMEQEGWEEMPIQPSVLEEYPEDDGWETGECEVYYYVSIGWNGAEA